MITNLRRDRDILTFDWTHDGQRYRVDVGPEPEIGWRSVILWIDGKASPYALTSREMFVSYEGKKAPAELLEAIREALSRPVADHGLMVVPVVLEDGPAVIVMESEGFKGIHEFVVARTGRMVFIDCRYHSRIHGIERDGFHVGLYGDNAALAAAIRAALEGK